MTITNPETQTRIDEIADGIYRISTPLPPNPALPAGFTFNQFLIDDEEPLLFHTGPRKMFPLVRQAIEAVTPGPERADLAASVRPRLPGVAASLDTGELDNIEDAEIEFTSEL